MRLLLLPLVLLALAGCDRPVNASDKLGLPLRSALAERERTGSDEPLAVLVRFDQPLDDARREALAEAGLSLRTEAGDTASAEGTATAVRAAAALPFVESVQLSQRRRAS